MEIISFSQSTNFFERISQLRDTLPDWLILEVKLKDAAQQRLTSGEVAEILLGVCGEHEGFTMVCNDTEVLSLIKWGKENAPQRLVMKVRNELPAESCEATVASLTTEGLKRMVLVIAPPVVNDLASHGARVLRRPNVILIADDDKYTRSLVKFGLKAVGTIVEVDNGNDVVEAYKLHNPDMVLLDIHLPGLEGQEVLSRIRSLDPKAYVIMISGDTSSENVKWTHQHGAKGFLAKPFNKLKLLDYVEKCPTIADYTKTIVFDRTDPLRG